MPLWVKGCQRIYRGVARLFPYEFRAVCGDGMERLGEDLVPLVWRQQGATGLIRLFADVVLCLPFEYVSSWITKLKEMTMTADLFEGTWNGNKEKSQWNPDTSPSQVCLRFEATETGYLMFTYGVKDGQAVAERPMSLTADGKRRPLVDLQGRPIPGVPPGAVAFGNRPDPYTLEGRVEVDGKMLGGGSYHVSEDGKTLTATMEFQGANGPFKVVQVFEKVTGPPLPK